MSVFKAKMHKIPFSLGLRQCSVVTIIFGPPANIRYGLTVLIHNSGHFGPPLPFWAPGPPEIAGAADGYSSATGSAPDPAREDYNAPRTP